MDTQQIVNQAKAKFAQALDHYKDELKKVRTGRAHASMVDGVMVEVYGTKMPLNQVAGVSTPEPQLIQISPYDANNIQAISTAIRENPNLGMNPADDGRVVRVPVPPLNEERRREYVKILGTKTEESLISLRNVRHEALKDIDQLKKDKQIGEDDAKRGEKQVDEEMNKVKTEIDQASKTKEAEIMSV